MDLKTRIVTIRILKKQGFITRWDGKRTEIFKELEPNKECRFGGASRLECVGFIDKNGYAVLY